MRNELNIKLKNFVVISVGELNDNKNHQVIIQAITKLPNVTYVVVGEGVLENYLKQLVYRLDVAERVIFTGYKTNVRDLLWTSDCFVFPSKREGLGLAAIEAMSAGLPLVVADNRGTRDFAGHGNLVVNCSSDCVSFFQAISHLLTYKTLRNDIGMKNSLFSKNFDTSITTSLVEKLYAEEKTL